ncbi:MAG: FtsQ-type POTRA domain-containing protein [Pseudomonadota bacterium]|nr:FtsQ-type POTRA domain-containing protein [Pseudomonadota bacterium]
MSPLRAVLTVVSVSSLVGGLAWLALGSEVIRFRTLRVVGNEHASLAQLRHLADLTPGAPLLTLDLDAAMAGVSRHPWVADAEARRVFPDTVVIQVRERQVRALLLLDGLYLVDTEGTPFRRADPDQLDHPVVTGLPFDLAESNPALARRIVQDALGILDAAAGRAGLREVDISEVRFDAESGYTLALRNGGEVLLGFPSSSGSGPAEAGGSAASSAFARLDELASRGVDLAHPLRIDLGSPTMAVVSPL